jgi:hypothetical protein
MLRSAQRLSCLQSFEDEKSSQKDVTSSLFEVDLSSDTSDHVLEIMNYSDDNFGNWDMNEGEEIIAFYHDVQRRSVWKRCKQCDEEVKILPHYAICNSCADANERGF